MRARTEAAAWAFRALRTVMGLSVSCAAGALAIAGFPLLAEVLGAGIWALALLLGLPARHSVFVPFLILISFPADHTRGLNQGAHGFFVLGATTLLALSSAFAVRIGDAVRTDWDLWALSGLLVLTALLQAHSGEIRGVMFWVSACLLLLWLRSEERKGARPRVQIETAIVVAGALGGLFAILERTGLLRVSDLLRGYEPASLELSVGMARAAGLSGHPLRLGSLSMLSPLVALAWMAHGRVPAKHRGAIMVALLLSLAGLALSGARGSWLGFAARIFLITILGDRSELRSRAIRAAALGFLLVGFARVTGIWGLFYERALGSASHPASLEQRLQVLNAVGQVWSQIPVFGLGFGGASDKIMALGLRALNIENEYLRFFLAAGWLAPVAILLLGVRRIRTALAQLPSVRAIVAIAALAALLLNMATF